MNGKGELLRYVLGLGLAAVVAYYTAQGAMQQRVTAVETKVESVQQDIRDIKSDVRELLQRVR